MSQMCQEAGGGGHHSPASPCLGVTRVAGLRQRASPATPPAPAGLPRRATPAGTGAPEGRLRRRAPETCGIRPLVRHAALEVASGHSFREFSQSPYTNHYGNATGCVPPRGFCAHVVTGTGVVGRVADAPIPPTVLVHMSGFAADCRTGAPREACVTAGDGTG